MNQGVRIAARAKFQQLLKRWPLLLATAFTLYSALLLSYTVNTWQRMRQDATDYLLADNQRRAATLRDFSDQLIDTTIAGADLAEIRTFLLNRDLGMSPRYGLNSSIAVIEQRFQQLSERLERRWNVSSPRIIFYSEDNELIADSHRGEPEPPPPLLTGMQPHMRVDPWRGRVELMAPVMHKGKRDGIVVKSMHESILYRNMIASSSLGHGELLLTSEGKPLTGFNFDTRLTSGQLRTLVKLPDNRVHEIKSEFFKEPIDEFLSEILIVKTPVPGTALVLVSFVPENLIYGHLPSRYNLIVAGALLLLMVLGAIKMDRMRREADTLADNIRAAEQQQAITEFRNIELSEEIERRLIVEKVLAETQERWELAIAGTNDGIWDWHIRSGDLFLSSRWKSMLGYLDSDVSNHLDSWAGLLHPEDRDRVFAEVDRHLRGDIGFYQCSMRMRCKDGSYKWILARGRALFDATGNAVRMAGSHTDISKQRESEDRIADRNAQLDAIFSLSPDAFVSFDAARRVKHANPAFLDMTGYKEADIVELDEDAFSARLANDCLPATPFEGVTAMRLAQESGESAPPRLLIELAGPGKRVIELKLRLADATTVSQILYLRDVTHEVEVDRMKSEFLSHAAHELRTPMASIYGFTELLVAQDFDAETRKDLLQTIHKQTAWLIEIINELLDISRIESRRGKDFKVEPVTLAPLVIDVLSSMQFDAERWPVTLNLPANLPVVRADAPKLRQVLLNILGNAVKYSPQGGGIVIAGASRLVGVKAMVSLAITDHGIGMTEEQVAHACERFYRADTSGNIPGTGLGMAIVKEVVELLGGSIDIASAPNLGTTVTILLPTALIAKP